MIQLVMTITEGNGGAVAMRVHGKTDETATELESAFVDRLHEALARMLSEDGGTGKFITRRRKE